MNKQYLYTSIIAATLSSFAARAQNVDITQVPDTLAAEELQEVVVEGQNQTAKAGKLSFIPSSTEKKVAQDGYDLLRHMSMPQISVDPINDNISYISGGKVETFINGLPASQSEVKNLKTTDVKRVEYLDYPVDPRYGGAAHVINFILKNYEWGGYTKLYANSTILSKAAVNTSVFSKFSYKKMMYDIFTGWNYDNSHHGGSDSKETYSLIDEYGDPYTAERTQITNKSRYRSWKLPVTLRATYSGNRFQAINSISYTFSETPTSFNSGQLFTTPGSGITNIFQETAGFRSKYAGWNGMYLLYLPKNFALNLSGEFRYAHNNNSSLYETNNETDNYIDKSSKEDIYRIDLILTLNKSFSQTSGIFVKGLYKQDWNKVNYTGSYNYKDSYNEKYLFGRVGYNAMFNKLRLLAETTIGVSIININSKRTTHTQPSAHISMSYAPSGQHQFNMDIIYSFYDAVKNAMIPNVIQENEIMYKQGNPNLKPVSGTSLHFGYIWMPSNKLQMAAYFNGSIRNNTLTETFSHYNNGSAIIKSYDNSTSYMQGDIAANVTYKPINQLQLAGTLAYLPNKITGSIHRSTHHVFWSMRGTYYIKNFFISASYGYKNKSLHPLNNGAVLNTPQWYTIRGGWGNGIWNVQLSANNIFRKDWSDFIVDLNTPLYSANVNCYGTSTHSSLNLSVTYTFSYGKHVRQGNEIGEQEAIESAAYHK